jgi:transposase
MNSFPQKNSVLVMDNAQIHHDEFLVNFIESIGCKVLFFLPYSPDFNPIETAFSVIKSWLKRNRNYVENCSDPYFSLTVACAQITPFMAHSFFQKSLYL